MERLIVSAEAGVRGKARAFPVRLPRFLSPLLLCAACWLPAGPARCADWPVFRGNNARTGYVSEQAYPPLTQQWSFQVQGDVVAGPVVCRGIVYAAARTGDIYALNAYTGELIWDYSTGDWVDASPAVSSSTVYAAGRDGHLYALNRLNGAVLWSANLGAPSVSSPLPLDGKVYVGVGAPVAQLRAYDAATGSLLWTRQANQPVDSAPSSDGSGVYFGSNDGRVYAVDHLTGHDLWLSPGYFQTIGSFGQNALPLSGGYLYALPGQDERKIFKLSADGSQAAASSPFAQVGTAYEYTGSENEVTSPVLSPYGVFAGAGSLPQDLYAFDASSLGDLAFSSDTFDLGDTASFGRLSSPAMADEVMYTGTADARMVAVSSSGAVLQWIALSSSSYASPAVSNGYVYAGVMGGYVIGYKAYRITSISAPDGFSVLDGTVPVYASLKSPVLNGYTIDYGAGLNPSSWTTITSTSSASVIAEISGAKLASWDVSQLPNGVYTLRLRTLETAPSNTLAEARNVVRVNHVPGPPPSLSAADAPGDSGNRITVGWTASPSAWVTAYRVYRGPSGAPLSYLAQVSTPSLSYTDAAAVTGSTFTYYATAYDGYAESTPSVRASAFSVDNDPSSDTVPPAAVTDLSGVPGTAAGSVLLAWTATGNDGTVGSASGYSIRYATYASSGWDAASVWKSSRPAAGPYGAIENETVTKLFGGVTYYFMLKAYDGKPNYSPASNTAGAYATVDNVPPLAPSGFAVSDRPGDHGGALVLTWALSPDDGAGARDVYGYKIFRSPASGAEVSSAPYAVSGAGSGVYTDTSAPVNLKFYYTVAAFDSTHDSTMTAEASGISADNWRWLDKSNGGAYRLLDGAEVDIPPDGADSDSILITRLAGGDYFGTSAHVMNDAGGAVPTGIVYQIDFEHATTKLLKSATLVLPYTAAEIGGIPPANLRVYFLDGARWRLVNTSSVEPASLKVTASIDKLGIYTVMGYVPSGALLSPDVVYTYPNPAKGDTLTFKFLPGDKSDVTIDVYNVAGEKVARLEKPSCPGGTTSEITWSVKNIASGVYIYRVEAKSASGSKAVIKKLAVIH